MKKILAFFFLFSFVFSITVSSTFALSEEQKRLYRINAQDYQLDTTCSVDNSVNNNESKTTISQVYMLGDSITEGSSPSILEEFSKRSISLRINASTSRSIERPGQTEGKKTSGLQAATGDKTLIEESQVAIVALGTNSDGGASNYKSKMEELISKIKGYNSSIKIYVVNLFSDVDHRTAYNTTLENLESAPTVIDVSKEEIATGSDKIHPTVAGQAVFAKKIANTVADATDITGSEAVQTGTIKEYPSQVDASLVPELKQILETIKPNLQSYQAAASRWGIPWQAIAATHWREGGAGERKSMVNGTDLPTESDAGAQGYVWGSADARISVRSTNKDAIPIGNGGAPPRRFYAKPVQDIDYATWLLIIHGLRLNPGFNNSPQAFIDKAQGPGLTKDEWERTWGAYLGALSYRYGSFGRDNQGRMGAGAIMAYLGGLDEKPPVPSVKTWPGSNDSDYNKVEKGVDGSATPGSPRESGSGCVVSGGTGEGGLSSSTGGLAPVLPGEPQGGSYGYGDAEGQGGRHMALDWFAKAGTRVDSPAGGKIVRVTEDIGCRNSNCQVFGGVVSVRDTEGRLWVMRHMDPKNFSTVGKTVSPGQQIGVVSLWGGGSATHVHLELYKKGSSDNEYGLTYVMNPVQAYQSAGLLKDVSCNLCE